MILYSEWQRLSITTRHHIAKHFGIAKTSPTHVQDNRVVNDGYNIEAIENVLNPDALRAFVGTNETDDSLLWKQFVDKVEGREQPQKEEKEDVGTVQVPTIDPPVIQKRRGRKPKTL